jgi:hypothetical protein
MKQFFTILLLMTAFYTQAQTEVDLWIQPEQNLHQKYSSA